MKKKEQQKTDNTPYLHQDGAAQMFFEGNFQLLGWNDLAHDYRLTMAILDNCFDPRDAVSILKEIGDQLKNKKYFFDGTVSSILWLNDRKLIDISKIKDDFLRENVEKCLENPRAYNPVSIDFNRWSYQAMLCKATTVNLALASNKLYISSSIGFLVEMLENQTLEDLRNRGGKWGTALNSLWLSLVANQVWHRRKDTPMGDFILENTVMGPIYPNEHPMGYVFVRMKPVIMHYGEQIFDDWHDHHPAFMQLWHAASIITFLAIGTGDERAELSEKYEFDGLYQFLNHILTDDGDFQEWFWEYFIPEFELRLPLIQCLYHLGIPVYLPLMESSQLMPSSYSRFMENFLPFFQMDEIPIELKDIVAKSLVRNIQRSMWLKEGTKQNLHDYKSNANIAKHINLQALTLLIQATLDPILKKAQASTLEKQANYIVKEIGTREEIRDLVQAAMFEILVEYDAEKYPKFFGFMDTSIPRKAQQIGRRSKLDESQVVLEPEEKETIADKTTNIESIVDQKIISEELTKFIENVLSPTEKRALEKKINEEKGMTAAERKALERARKKARDAGLKSFT